MPGISHVQRISAINHMLGHKIAFDQGDLVVTKGDQYDVRDKGSIRNLGRPVVLAKRYYEEGADEVTFLNITGFRDFPLKDMLMLRVLEETSKNVFVLLTIGGGIRDYTDSNGRSYSALDVASQYFRSGAGCEAHFSEVFEKIDAEAALAAGIFHRREVSIQAVKNHLIQKGIEVR